MWGRVCRPALSEVEEPAQVEQGSARAVTPKPTCHPERRGCFAKRSSVGVEGPLYSQNSRVEIESE